MAAARINPSFIQRWVVDYNPFYLLSAVSMLLGCLMLTNSLSWSSISMDRLLMLTAALHVYELCLVGLALFLIRRFDARRDGSMLLILEAFFLADVTFLNVELLAKDRVIGLWANVAVLVITFAKLLVIARFLKIDLRSWAVRWAGLMVLALVAIPVVLKLSTTVGSKDVPPLLMYGLWWCVAVLGMLGLFAFDRRYAPGKLAWIVPTVGCVLLASVVAHLGTSHFVYRSEYVAAYLAPMLMLAALVVGHARARNMQDLVFHRVFAIVLVSVATIMTTGAPGYLDIDLPMTDRVLTPTRITALIGFVLLSYILARPIFRHLMLAGVLGVTIAIFGPGWTSIRTGLQNVWAMLQHVIELCVRLIDSVRPKSQQQWGVLGVFGAFFFLLIGLAVSVLGRRDLKQTNTSDDPV